MKVRCEYCGDYIESTEERCPHCGAVNEQYQREAPNTPQTIEQLKDWYKARNLPPEEETRFFIGKDIREPRAFGIYEDNGQFTVYKNKADGSRAIRYEGTDEAYAVNELYLRLKEEILHQKNLNLKRNTQRGSKNKKNNKNTFLYIVLAMFILPIIVNAILLVSTIGFIYSNPSTKYNSYSYYYPETKELFYCEDSYDGDWWQYNFEKDDWEKYEGLTTDSIPQVVANEGEKSEISIIYDSEQISKDHGKEYSYDDLSIYESKNYIDSGHHFTPSQRYYKYNNEFYYYLDDNYGASYGMGDNSGWYKYSSDSNDWSYYCDEDDKSLLGDDLYYYDDRYVIHDFENDVKNVYDYLPNENWVPSTFEDTSWYVNSVEAETKHNEEMDNYDYDNNSGSNWSWDNDSDWDWDSGDSWDSGGSDWDSDW